LPQKRDLTVAQALLLVPVATGNRSRGQLEPAQGHPHQTQSTIVGAIDQKRITIQVEEGLLLEAEKSASTMKGPNKLAQQRQIASLKKQIEKLKKELGVLHEANGYMG
jgi:hypothetical protein